MNKMSLHAISIDLSLHCPFLPGSLCMADGVCECVYCVHVCVFVMSCCVSLDGPTELTAA